MAEQLLKDGCDEYTIEKFIQQEKDADEFARNEGTTDIEAVRLWKSYPNETRRCGCIMRSASIVEMHHSDRGTTYGRINLAW